MKKYEVRVQFIFEGIFTVNAKSRTEARTDIELDCGLVMGGGIHSNLNDEDIDWDFNIHPDTKIVAVKPVRKKK